MRAAVVFNPSAGKGRGHAIASAVERRLAARGLHVELHCTHSPADATAISRYLAPAVDIIVAVGGDGTVNEVANGMASAADTGDKPAPFAAGSVAADSAFRACPTRRALLGIVPAGTVNVFALELGLPFQVERACEVITGDKTISLDLGRVNGRRFLLMMGAGIDALTVRNIDPGAKRRFKELAFLGTGLKKGLAEKPPVFLVRAGGQEYRATFFVAGNSRHYGGRTIRMTPTADPTDGMLDLLLFTGTSRSSLVVFWLGLPSGLHLRNSRVTYLRAEKAELLPVDGEKAVWFQTDGELAGRLPATVEIESHALEVLVP